MKIVTLNDLEINEIDKCFKVAFGRVLDVAYLNGAIDLLKRARFALLNVADKDSEWVVFRVDGVKNGPELTSINEINRRIKILTKEHAWPSDHVWPPI